MLKLSQFILRNIVETSDVDINKLVNLIIKYYNFDGHIEVNEMEPKSELNLWKSKWIREKNEGEYILKYYYFYFNILNIILNFRIKLYVKPGRSFSTLRR